MGMGHGKEAGEQGAEGRSFFPAPLPHLPHLPHSLISPTPQRVLVQCRYPSFLKLELRHRTRQ